MTIYMKIVNIKKISKLIYGCCTINSLTENKISFIFSKVVEYKEIKRDF